MTIERKLLAQVYSDPTDLEARAVYADALSQSDDPRGELIALQLIERPTKSQSRRARELARRHGHAWLGELRPLFQAKFLQYRVGFPWAGRFNGGVNVLVHSYVGHPAWATFGEIHFHESIVRQVDETFFAHAVMRRSLRSLKGLALTNLAGLARSATPWPYEHISLCPANWLDAGRLYGDYLRAGYSLPNIKSLELGAVNVDRPRADFLIESPLWRDARRLSLDLRPRHAISWAAPLEQFITSKDDSTLSLRCVLWALRTKRKQKRATLTASYVSRTLDQFGEHLSFVRDLLRAFSRHFLAEVTLRLADGCQWDARLLRSVDASLDFLGERLRLQPSPDETLDVSRRV